MNAYIYPGLFKIGDLQTDVVVYPFYIKESIAEFDCQKWETIYSILPVFSDHIEPQVLRCSVHGSGHMGLIADHDLHFFSPGVEHYNSYVLYNRISTELILFNQFEESWTTAGTLHMFFDNPLITVSI